MVDLLWTPFGPEIPHFSRIARTRVEIRSKSGPGGGVGMAVELL